MRQKRYKAVTLLPGQGIEGSQQSELLCQISLNIVCFNLHGVDLAQHDRPLEAFTSDGTARLTDTHRFAG